jgi:dCMP deaminase
MRIAYQVASESKAEKRKVGAVIVKDNNIIALGYNGTPSGFDNCCEDEVENFSYEQNENKLAAGENFGTKEKLLKTRPEVLHAESNAISKCARSTYSSEGADIFVTTAPCIECAKLIIQAGIKNVFWSEEYKTMDGIRLLEQAKIYVKRVIVKLEPILIKIPNSMTDEEREEFKKKWMEFQASDKTIWLPSDWDKKCNHVWKAVIEDDKQFIQSSYEAECIHCGIRGGENPIELKRLYDEPEVKGIVKSIMILANETDNIGRLEKFIDSSFETLKNK